MLLSGLDNRLAKKPDGNLTGRLLLAVLAVALAGCMAYQPPSGRGYDYDRGRAMAGSDVRSGHLIYLMTGPEADRLPALSQRTAANCGFHVRLAHPDTQPPDFAEGYNAVSVPVIEQRLGATIEELMRRCGVKDSRDR